MNRDFLSAGNPRRIHRAYGGILSQAALRAIDRQTTLHVIGIFNLGAAHYQFARKLAPAEWRQRISRLYYSAYHTSRAVRFCRDGHYSTDALDHKKIGDLPDDFPNKNRYAIELPIFRDERNTADYDHMAALADLVNDVQHYLELSRDLISDSHGYLKNRGIKMGKKP